MLIHRNPLIVTQTAAEGTGRGRYRKQEGLMRWPKAPQNCLSTPYFTMEEKFSPNYPVAVMPALP
jgi:hypothetical protein